MSNHMDQLPLRPPHNLVVDIAELARCWAHMAVADIHDYLVQRQVAVVAAVVRWPSGPHVALVRGRSGPRAVVERRPSGQRVTLAAASFVPERCPRAPRPRRLQMATGFDGETPGALS